MTRIIGRLLLALAASVAPVIGYAQTETVTYYHTDAIGSVRMVTNEAAQVVARYDFQPFGLPLPVTPAPPPEARQFAGTERDTETEFDYFGARYYASGNGRFTTVDPVLNLEAALTEPQRWNRYAYAVNNPLKFTDPDGRDPRLITGAIGAVVYAGWNTFVNVQQGNAWYQSIGMEASKGFLVGVTLGLAAPALAGTTATDAITSATLTTTATAATSAATRSSGDIGRIIGWGRGQSPADVAQTLRATRELTASQVVDLVKQGVTREWVEKQLVLYRKSLETGNRKLENRQLLPRIEFMEKLLGYWPDQQ
jgi:RHS repeat-associated protein